MIPARLRATGLILGTLLVCAAASVQAQRGPLQQRLAAATALNCTFSLVSTGTWTKGAPSAASTPARLTVAFTNINVDEGTADAQGAFGASFIVVRQAGDYLHLMQTYSAGPLYTTTVLARETTEGRLMAVHTRHEYTDVAIPGFTSRPEMYLGECEIK